MEKAMSTQDKIKRAEEIYNKRKNQEKNGTARVNINNKKDLKLLKKTLIQMVVCLAIYSLFYLIKNNNYIFSEDFINKAKEILTYDIDFQELYYKSIENFKRIDIKSEEKIDNVVNTEENIEKTDSNNTQEDSGIGGTEEEVLNELSQMEKDALEIKESINFINPIDGVVTSGFGLRNPTTNTVPKYHTGLDIANKSGTKILSATDGKVILASSEGDYRKSFKDTNQRCYYNICSL